MRIYIESTIPSYVAARPARDLLQAARQQLTRDWWESRSSDHNLFASQLVLDEIAVGEPEMATRRLELMNGVPLLQSTDEAEELACAIMEAGLLPEKASPDGTHIALATVHAIDILLTWNCRHIANAFILGRLRRLIESRGYNAPVICTPEEFLQQPYD